MGIKIYNYQFEGPYSNTNNFTDNSGVYAIICSKNDGKNYFIDVGESATIKSRLENHDRKCCWNKKSIGGTIKYAVHYTPNKKQTGRIEIEQEIRKEFGNENLCGDK